MNRHNRYLIIHADDAGMCHSANRATIHAMTDGAVSSASVMVPCPWFSEFAAWASERPDMDVGVHLTLTSEWKHYRWGPVAPKEHVPGLLDDEGYLWRRVEDVVKHATAREVEIEARAQIERALRIGVRPTHIDSHMGTLFAHPEFLETYLALSAEYGIPAMLPRPTEEQLASELGKIVAARLGDFERRGFRVLDRLITSVNGDTYKTRKESLLQAITGLGPGVTQVIVHLMDDDPEARGIANSWHIRAIEYKLCLDEEIRAHAEQEGVALVGYRDLAEL